MNEYTLQNSARYTHSAIFRQSALSINGRRGPLQRERDGFLLPPLTSAQSTVADLYGGGALRPSLPP